MPELREAGADVVFSGEGEVALSMTEFLLRQLGATPEQIDRERARIRSDLFGESPEPESLPKDRLRPASDTEMHVAQDGLTGIGREPIQRN